MTTPTSPVTLSREVGSVQRWLDGWPEGSTYTFNRDQMQTVIDATRIETEAASRAVTETPEGLDRLIERVRTMPPNGVISRWENVSRSAVVDLLLAHRAALTAEKHSHPDDGEWWPECRACYAATHPSKEETVVEP